MKNEKIAIGLVLFLLIVTACGCISYNDVNVEDIRIKIIEKFDNLQSYKYTSLGDITTIESNPTDYSPTGGPYSLDGEIDIHHKRIKTYMNVELTDEMIESLKNQNVTLNNETLEFLNRYFYFENDTLYTSYDNLTWDVWDTKPINWYAFAYLDRQFHFLLENATLKLLDDDIVGGSKCYTLEVTPKLEDIDMRSAYMDYLFPMRYEESSIHVEFEQVYDTNIKYWVEKDTYLIKKIYIKAENNHTRSFNVTEYTTYNTLSIYETEILFYDYNQVTDIESPWQEYENEAMDLLDHLDYSNTRFGFGLNLPEDWTVEEGGLYSSGGGQVPIFYLANQSWENLSLLVGPPSRYSGNLSEEINEKSESIAKILNDSNYTIYYENYSLETQGSTIINGMEAYEFVTSYEYNGIIIKTREIFIEEDDRLFSIHISGYGELYEEHMSNIDESLDSSFIIIAPYFEIYEM